MVKKHWILGHLNDVIDSLVAGVSVNSGEDDASGNFFILKTSAISKGKLNLSEKKPVLPREVARLKCSLRQETILISRMNTPELVGECAYVPCDDPRIYLPDRIWQTNFKKDVDVSAKWLNYLLSSKKYRSLIQNCATGTSNSMKNISKEQLLGLEILYPSFREQTSIAEALSDVDSLISSLQELIEKKKAIKQGAMQELLTGKKRLPGFSGEWSKQQLGDICNIVNGGTPSTSIAEFWNGKILWCTPTDITSCSTKYIYTTESKITESGLKASSATLLPKGALLLCSRATIGEVRIAGNTICTNQGFKSLVVHQNISNEWLYYMVHVLKFNMLEKAIGSTFLEISKKDLAELDIIVPEFTEQKAIAQVLSDMDSEIELLEKKLAKYQQIKQGMMQELLTGRIRLV